ncbi:hypothetical protein HU200_014029 [Digitaria exilis]|uniref:Small nuclear ribonucleoprotein Sm D3 n=1 Tax=Digitaria exilis TaxID=1010633 RepID=A0A835FC41_9POAL|nr:hypothetical protein HU200_014029 [Digitaria exilis]
MRRRKPAMEEEVGGGARGARARSPCDGPTYGPLVDQPNEPGPSKATELEAEQKPNPPSSHRRAAASPTSSSSTSVKWKATPPARRSRRVTPPASRMSRSLGIPVKLLHEAAGHVVTVELKTGEVYRGAMVECEDNWNCQLDNITFTAKDGKVSQLEHVFIRGSRVRFMIIPDMLKNAPMFKRLEARIRVCNFLLLLVLQ